MLAKFIQQQRKKRELTQEYLAVALGISRPTYMQIERGERELTITEAKKLASVLGISLEDFLNEREEALPVVNLEKGKKTRIVKKKEIRISIPQEKADKFKQTLLYILKKIGGKSNIGQTMLYKLLYFIDFDYYEIYEEQLTGAKYIKNTYGPTPVMFAKIITQLEAEEKIEIGK